MASRGRTAHITTSKIRSSSVPSDNKKQNRTGLCRQIGEHKWYAGVSYLSYNPDKNDITVAEHYTGWRFVLMRTKSQNVFVTLTYYHNKLVIIEKMIIHSYEAQNTTTTSSMPILPSSCGASVLGIWQPPMVRCISC